MTVKLYLLPHTHAGPVVHVCTNADGTQSGTPGPELTPTPHGTTRMAYHAGTLYVASIPQTVGLVTWNACDHDRAAALGYGESHPFPFWYHVPMPLNEGTLGDALRKFHGLDLPPESREETLRQLTPTSAADGLRLYVARALFGWHLEVITHTCPDMLTVKAFDGQAFRIVRVSERTLMDAQLGGMGVASVGARIVEALRTLAGGKGTTI